jgi:dCMP deaminase
MSKESWDQFFLRMCDIVSEKSKDTSTKVGCVIVGPDNEVRTVGFNGFPRGVDDSCPFVPDYKVYGNGSTQDPAGIARYERVAPRYERPLKYKWTEHAERNAIYNAARCGIVLKGCTIYFTSVPLPFPCCSDCARAIIQSGIIRVVFRNGEIPDRWKEDCAIAIEMLSEAGITIDKA